MSQPSLCLKIHPPPPPPPPIHLRSKTPDITLVGIGMDKGRWLPSLHPPNCLQYPNLKIADIQHGQWELSENPTSHVLVTVPSQMKMINSKLLCMLLRITLKDLQAQKGEQSAVAIFRVATATAVTLSNNRVQATAPSKPA